jgi:GeoRSP system PqqD family protein
MVVAMKRLICNDSAVCAEIGDEAVLLQVDTGVYFGLDTVGTRIWQLLSSATTADSIVETLLQEFDVERRVLEQDVAAFLSRLREKGLVQEVDD